MKKNVLVLFVGLVVAAARMSFASEMVSSADALEGGHWKLTFYGVGSKMEPKVKVTDTQAVQVQTVGGSATLFSSANTEFELEQEMRGAAVRLAVRPREGLTYRLTVGQIREFEVDVPSGTASNTLESLDNGFLWGVGLGWNLTQGTIVSAAVAVDLAYMRKEIDLDRFESATQTLAVNHRLAQDEFQAALTASRRWKRIEPFAGLRVFQVRTELADRSTQEKVAGRTEGFAPFVGLEWNIFEGESLVLEGSFVDEEAVSAGLCVRF